MPTSMSSADHARLRRLVKKYCPSLEQLIDHCIRNSSDTDGLCPLPFREFIADLSRRSPVPAGLIRDVGEVKSVLAKLLPGQDTPRVGNADVNLVERCFPSLYNCVAAASGADGPVRPETMTQFFQHNSVMFEPVIRRMITFCSYLDTLNTYMKEDCDKPFGFIDPDIENLIHISHFPGAPVIRKLHRYDHAT